MSDLRNVPRGVTVDRRSGKLAVVVDSFEEACDLASGWPATDGFHRDVMSAACELWPDPEDGEVMTSDRPVCRQCDRGAPVVAEIEGRVLVCVACRDDDDLRRMAESEYR